MMGKLIKPIIMKQFYFQVWGGGNFVTVLFVCIYGLLSLL